MYAAYGIYRASAMTSCSTLIVLAASLDADARYIPYAAYTVTAC